MFQPEFISKTKIEFLSALGSSKMRRRKGIFPVEGLKSILDILPAFQPVALIVNNDVWQTKFRAGKESVTQADKENGLLPKIAAGFKPETIRLAEDSEMKRLSSLSTPPPAIAYFEIPEYSEDENALKLDRNVLYLLLDGVRDPGNLGTIIRTADWFGVHKIYCSHDSADIFNQKVIQATMGSLAHVEVYYCDLADLVSRNPGIPLFGTLLEGRNIYSQKLPDCGMIVMGNEGKGISEEMKKLISDPLTIPPYSGTHGESLNVAIAAGIVLSEFRRGSEVNA